MQRPYRVRIEAIVIAESAPLAMLDLALYLIQAYGSEGTIPLPFVGTVNIEPEIKDELH